MSRTVQKYGHRHIVITSLVLLLLSTIFAAAYRIRIPQTAARMKTDRGITLSIDERYITYQYRMNQYAEQKERKLSTASVDEVYWERPGADGLPRSTGLKKKLKASIRAQLMLLAYARKNQIILDEQDRKTVDDYITMHSAPEERQFIGDGEEPDRDTLRLIFEHLVLADKAIRIGAKKEESPQPADPLETRAVQVEVVVVERDANAENDDDETNRMKHLTEILRDDVLDGKTMKAVADRYEVGYKSDLVLSLMALSDEDPNRETVRTAVTLQPKVISEVMPYYQNTRDGNVPDAYVFFRLINERHDVTRENEREYILKDREERFRQRIAEQADEKDFTFDEFLFDNLR
ncbi:MAG: hypothetical protein Q4P30_00475 [Eubacteriales bacterium]|nr:hypothetical protein [Eubacteriales bacterium]